MEPSGARILVVDDYVDTISMLRTALRLEGYTARTASTIQEALDIAENNPIDLYIIDYRLTGGTGLELCARLRANGHTGPVIYYTGVAFTREMIKAVEESGDTYVMKPFDIEDLKVLITIMLTGAKTNGAST